MTLNDGGTASYVSGTGSNTLKFNYTVASGQNTSDLDYSSTAALTLNGGTIEDAAGNIAMLTLPATGSDGLATRDLVIETTSPAVSSVGSTQSSGAYAAGTVIPLSVTFSQAVNVTGTPQLALNDGGTASYASGTGSNTLKFNYAVASGQNTSDLDYSSTTALSLNGGTIKDAAGNIAVLTLPATGSDGLATDNLVIETTAPSISSVSSIQPSGTYPAGTIIPISVALSEAVNVTGAPQLALNDGGTANYVSGTGSNTLKFNYTVAGGQNTSDLDYTSTTALLLNGGTIEDAAGNTAVLTLPATGSDGLATDNLVIEATAPSVTSVSSTEPTGTYAAGTVIPISVVFSQAVNVTGTPQLTLNDGGTASYVSGTGSNTLKFNYTVVAGQNTSDLDYSSTTALSLNGGTIQDAAGNTAVPTLPATGSDGLAAEGIDVDTIAQPVSVSTTTPDGLYNFGGTGSADGSILISVVFNEAVNVTGTPQLTLNDGGTANYTSGSGTNTLIFEYKIGANDDTPNSSFLDYSANGLTLNGGTITDTSGTAPTLRFRRRERKTTNLLPRTSSLTLSPRR